MKTGRFLSKQGHLQPHPHLKARQLSKHAQLKNCLFRPPLQRPPVALDDGFVILPSKYARRSISTISILDKNR